MWKRAAIAGLLLIVALAILLQTGAFQQWVLREIQSRAAAAGIDFRAERLRFSIWELRATLDGVVYESDAIRVTVRRVLVDVPWSILSGDVLRFDLLEIDGLAVEVRPSDPARPAPQEPDREAASIPRFEFGRLIVRDGSFRLYGVEDGVETVQVAVPAFALDIEEGLGTLTLNAPIEAPSDVRADLQEVPIEFYGDGLRFGPLDWAADFMDYSAAGNASGQFRWTPDAVLDVSFTANVPEIEGWQDIRSNGRLHHENGVLRFIDVEILQGGGEVLANAELSEERNRVDASWNALDVGPSGIPGVTSGAMELTWSEDGFADISGAGAVAFTSPQFGSSRTNVTVRHIDEIQLDVTATAFDAAIQARITTGLNERLAGTFQAVHRQYGPITARGNLSGTWRDPIAAAAVDGRGLVYEDVGPADFSAQVVYRSNVLSAGDIRAAMDGSRIDDASVRIDLASRRIQGEIPASTLLLEDFVEDAAGAIQIAAALAGTLDRPLAEFQASSGTLTIADTAIDSLQMDGRFDDGVLHVDRLAATQQNGELQASGALEVETRAVEAAVSIRNFAIVDVAELSATAFLDAAVSGTIAEPVAAFTGQLLDIVYREEPHGNLQLDGRVENKLATVTAVSDRYTATLAAEVGIEQPYPFTATLTASQTAIEYEAYRAVADGRIDASGRLQPFELDDVGFVNFFVNGHGANLLAEGTLNAGIEIMADADLAQAPVDGVQLGGTAQISGVVSGTIDNPRIEGFIETYDAAVQLEGMTEPAAIQASIDFTRDEFHIRELHASMAGATAAIEGQGTLRGTGEFRFAADGIAVERFLTDRPVSGVIGLEGSATVAAPSLSGVNALVRTTQLDLALNEVEIRQVAPIEIALENEILSIRRFSLEGLDTSAEIRGSANLNTQDLDLTIEADTDLGAFEAFVPGSAVEGRLRTNVQVRGSMETPDLNGSAEIVDAQFIIENPPVLLTALNAEIEFRGDRFEIRSATGDLNAGRFEASGGSGFSGGGLRDAALSFRATSVQLEFPEGLQSEIAADLRLTGSAPNLALEGTADIVGALYRQDIHLDQEIFARVLETARPAAAAAAAAPPEPGLAEQIRLDLTVRTVGPVVVSNNLANLDLSGVFQVRGTIAEPILLGRAAVSEGGELYFGAGTGRTGAAIGERGDRYLIERGSIDFVNPVRTEPTFDFEATHEFNRPGETILIRLTASGTPGDLDTELTSDADPPLSEPDIAMMLLTGRTRDELQSEPLAAAQDLATAYLAGRVSGIFDLAGNTLGLDTVRIDPVAMATEGDIGAQLTVGKNITRDFSVLFSQNLRDASTQTWMAAFEAYNGLTFRVLNTVNEADERLVRLELRHDLRVGGGPPLPGRITPGMEATLGAVRFTGTQVPAEELMQVVTAPGRPYSIYRMYDDVRRLRAFFTGREFLTARVRPTQAPRGDEIDVEFAIVEGPAITFDYEGVDIPGSVRDQVRQIWVDGFAEAISLRDSRNLLLRHFRDRGYLEAAVDYRDDSTSPDARHFVFVIAAGMRYQNPEWVFDGIPPLPIPETAGQAMEAPQEIQRRIEFDLQKAGHLDANVSQPELILENGTARFEIHVDPGPQFTVGRIDFDGNDYFTGNWLQDVIAHGPTPVEALQDADRPAADAAADEVDDADGEELDTVVFTSDWIETARQRLIAEYWHQGFNDVQVTPTTEWDPDTGQVIVAFTIVEGDRQMVDAIQVSGANITRMSHVMRQFTFAEGDPVDYARINLTRKKLYDTRLFKLVDIDLIPGPSGYRADVVLNEQAPWRFQYGISLDSRLDEETERRTLGFTGDVIRSNIMGRGISAGFGVSVSATGPEGRVFASMPVFFDRDIVSTATVFRTIDTRSRDSNPSCVLPPCDIRGTTLQQQVRLRDFYILTYDYGYKWTRSMGSLEPGEVLDPDRPLLETVGRLNASLIRDTRDDILNATRGRFLSNSFEVAPPLIGAGSLFVKNYAQYFRFEPIGRNVVWASTYRLGLAGGFGGKEVPLSEQFLAGGDSTVRGFPNDRLTPDRGNAVLILNQEIRRPLFWRFGGVAFVDAGNVYPTVSDMQFWKLRYSAGVGLRFLSPFLLLRSDLGVNLAPREGESRYRITFGIGQAF